MGLWLPLQIRLIDKINAFICQLFYALPLAKELGLDQNATSNSTF